MNATATNAATDVELARLAKALGHPVRVRLLRMLLAEERCYCKDMVEALPLSQPTVSQHLKVLKDAGLITGQIERPRVCYCADRAQLDQLHELVGGLLADAAEGTTRGCD